MKTWIALCATAVLAASASVALAASLGVGSAALGAGVAAVPRCDANGFTYTFTTSGGDLTAVTVADLADPACEGGELQLTLTDSTGASIASGGPQPVPTDGDSVANSLTVSTTPQPSATQVAGIHVSVNGP